jgi:predicted nucleic acid-binding protein
MSYSIDANILLYASNKASPFHVRANEFLASREDDSDLLCLTWPTLMAYLRISTHPNIFSSSSEFGM